MCNSPFDHLVRFEMFCRDFIHNQHLGGFVVVVVLFLRKFDATWKYGIMKDLYGFGLRQRLSILINNISFKDRYFKVRVGSTFSGSLAQEMVVPQGMNE